MFISAGALVNVVSGRLSGRFGRVAKIVIDDVTHHVTVFVYVFDPVSGDMPVMIFEPHELKRRKFNEREEIALMELEDASH